MTNLRESLDNRCSNCLKPQRLCLCVRIVPVSNKTRVLILQHPQENREALSTAWLTHLALSNSIFRVGLSWPNLASALGNQAESRCWGVLFLGTIRSSSPAKTNQQPVNIIDRHGKVLPDSAKILKTLQGIVALDGNWRQAKALWWRNPWLLKLKRIVLLPPRRSLYSQVRREPRRESLSTLEAIAMTISAIEDNQKLEEDLLQLLRYLISRYRAGRTT